MAPGNYVYTITGTAPCSNATATVVVTETGSPNAGTDGSLTVCSNGAAASLFAQLGGTPDAGGTWSGPSPVVGGNYDPATMTAGVYTYTLAAIAPCVAASAEVLVSLEVAPNAGSDAPLTVCAGAAAQDLFPLLGASANAGGSWSGPGGPFDGVFDPGSNGSGSYTYAVTGLVCPSDVADITVTVVAGPDAGGDNALVFCSTSGVFQLLGQLQGTPDPGGVWTLGNGSPTSATFDPSISLGGSFIYTVTGNGDCPNDQAQVDIQVNTAPQAGTGGAISLCASGASTSLFDGLGGTLDAGGVWTAPDGTLHPTVVDPAVDPSGNYTYTVLGASPCVNASAVVALFVAPVANAGGDGAADFCSTNAPVALLELLAGSPQADGLWTGPSGSLVAPSFVPLNDQPGLYTYTVPGIAPCNSDLATVTISVSQAANAGQDNAITTCENSAVPLPLFDSLNGMPDPNGTWTGPDGTAFNGIFTPGVDPEGAYQYAVAALAPCQTDLASIQVDILPVPIAAIDLVGNLGCTPAEVTLSSASIGSASCTWILWNGDVVNDCAPITQVFEQAGVYNVTLIVDAGNGCGADTLEALGLIRVYQQPVADFDHLPEGVNTLDPVVQFNNTSTDAESFLWDIAGLANTTDVNTSYRFPSVLGDEYTVCLIAVASANCLDTLCRSIVIEDAPAVYVPNSFTPDGSGINDIFKPIVLGVDRRFYRFDIFDRWGQPLFSTEDPDAAWNGLFSNGTEVPTGVYVWKLVAKDQYSGARIEQVGSVTLLR